MKREETETSYPLSPMQQGMLFHALSASHTGVDIEQVLVTLREELDVALLERAWKEVLAKHEALRNTFHWNGAGDPFQQTQTQVRLPFHCEDWRQLSLPQREDALNAWLRSDRLRGFDLACAPLTRVTLFRLQEAEWQLVWTFHHLILDASGIVIVLRDVFALYECLQEKRAALPGHAPSFRAHIEHLQTLDKTKAKTFWEEKLRGFSAPVSLSLPAPAECHQGGTYRHQELCLSTEDTKCLASFVAAHNITLNTMVQAAWALLLARYSGTRDVVFGAVRGGRRSSTSNADSVAGIFINTVPVRVCVGPETPVLSFLTALRDNWVSIRPYEHTSLVDIQGWTEVSRDTPLFDTLVNFQPRSVEAQLQNQGGKWINRAVRVLDQPNYPLVLDVCGGESLGLKVLYDGHRFDDATMGRLLGHVQELLLGMAQKSDRPLQQLSLLTPEDRQLLDSWNQTTGEYPGDKCIHELFEDQAQRMPNQLALKDLQRRMTYAELDSCANRLAAKLHSLEIGPDVLVAICMERSMELVAASLGILKAGGAYVPLDPANPPERLAFMLKEANISVLLASQTSLPNPQWDGLPVKIISTNEWFDPMIAAQKKCEPTRVAVKPHARNLAYVIFTSGSTGTPKGVQIEHRSVINLISWHQRTYGITSEDHATLLANPSFDASVWELWPYLTAGATVHIPDYETVHLPSRLISWLRDEGITIGFVPTPLAEALFEECWPAGCKLRALLTGGDKLRRPPPKDFPCALVNHYGPTENTVVTTSKKIAPTANGGTLPIGRPISNTKVFILDEQLEPLPIGVPGDLCIGGDGLARGYLNPPELTKEKFVSAPLRLYRTGDRARWLPNGDLEFLGRADQQIKIRGHRVELAEIESALLRHGSIRTAAVIAQQDNAQTILTAFVVKHGSSPMSVESLRKHLQQFVPDYMQPGSFVFLEELPLTSNGKLDRKALSEIKTGSAHPREHVAPRSRTEKSLSAIWREVLGLEQVGVYDDFFSLGGHSLLAARVISRVEKEFNQQLPLRDFFNSPTIHSMAQILDRPQKRSTNGSFENSIVVRNGRVPISFAQERLWFLEQLHQGTPMNNIPFAFQIQGDVSRAALEKAMGEVIRRHEALRTVFTNVGGQPMASIASPTEFSVPLTDLSSLSLPEQTSRANQLTIEEARRPFDLSKSPLLRGTLLKLSPVSYRLLLTTHHIACDGWSMDVLFRELGEYYGATLAQQPFSKSLPAWSYADFAQWQRDAVQADLEKHLPYWTRQLAGAPTALDLPGDRPRAPVQTHTGATQEFKLSPELSAKLRKFCRKEGVTPFMLLVAALYIVLQRHSGQVDIVVGTPAAGRLRVETENLIGLFLNTLALRGDLSGDPGFREFLNRVKLMALDAFEHQLIPFEKLADTIQPARDLSRPPVFQVMLILQNEPQRPLELTGLQVTPVRVHTGTAKFDLTFSLEESANGLGGYIEYNTDLFDERTISRLGEHFQNVLEGAIKTPEQRISELPLLSRAESAQLASWNNTSVDFCKDKCLHDLIEEQVHRTPDAIALVSENDELTYRELSERADRVARALRDMGVGPDVRVGICMTRSLNLVVGLLGILKAGGCYVPLDPTYPAERIAFMLEDSQAPVLLTQEDLSHRFETVPSHCIVRCMDSWADVPERTSTPTVGAIHSNHLAYVIYTSGSTGNPKGVMLTHRNVVNFFSAMDRLLGTKPGVWLAVTSVSFDISVLELFWPLSRGYKIVIQPDAAHKLSSVVRTRSSTPKMDFGLFYFASDAEASDGDRYRLLLEGAKFADANGFGAVWTPERHFHPFGGIFPNPSVVSAAIAMITRRIQIRAGSIVLPLHDPVRAAEEWSVVDNLSKGRVAIALASGWHKNDFALRPETYSRRKEILRTNADIVRQLWRGETVAIPNETGETAQVRIFPKPIQRELPMWLTSSGNPETFRVAGELGFNLLTHLSGQDTDKLGSKIELYRKARREAGYESPGHVSVMLHTFVWNDLKEARALVWEPLLKYLRTYRSLSETANEGANGHSKAALQNGDVMEHMLNDAAQRYLENCGLIGTCATCLPRVEKLQAIGADEIACLIDFGVAADSVLQSLRFLNELRERTTHKQSPVGTLVATNGREQTVAELVLRHKITHLQCTPSLAGALATSQETLTAMRHLRVLLVGGEALSVDLAGQLRRELPCELFNMYGPTETCIWSATYRVDETRNSIPIGRPIANTQIHIVDRNLQLVPVGVAGELLIGGEGVARGYLNRPELTREKFIPDPFSADSQARLYRTGDLARWCSDGNIEFLGRLDQQIKLRGHRIELGEIESVLRGHPAIRECAVAVQQNSATDQRLVAYIVGQPDRTASAQELQQFLEPKLPDYMIPSAFAMLDRLPLTPNGKLDRKALPEVRRPATDRPYVAPRSEKEQTIAKVWRELLQVEEVGLHDNFFDLGGHSLLVVQAQARLRAALGVEVPVVRLFQYPTISALTSFLGNGTKPDSLRNVRERGRRQREMFSRRNEMKVTA